MAKYLPPPGYRLPNQPFLRFGYDGNLWLPGVMGPARALLEGPVLGFIRSIATRASVPNNFGASTASYTNRTFHISRDNITDIQVAWANASLQGNSGEVAVGNQTQFGQVEYPAGNYYPLNWSGSPSIVAAPFTMPLSDPRRVNIPANTGFWIESRLIGATNLLYADGTQKSTASGDAQQTNGTDMSNIVNNTANVTFPSLIVGRTNNRAPLGIGDSRFVGLSYDQAGAGTAGNNGDFQTAFSPNYAGTRYGSTGLTGLSFGSANHTIALALAQYHTDLIYELGINDLNVGGTSAATVQARTLANVALFTALGLKPWLTTIQPSNTSNNNWIDLAGQTVNANDAARVAYNNLVRAGMSGIAGFFEYANLVESSLNSGKWKFDGTAFKYTNDGTHLNNFSTPLAGPFTLS